MARRRYYRHRQGFGEPGSGVPWIVFGGLAVATGAVILIARSSSAAPPPMLVPPPPPPPGTVAPPLTPQQIKEMQLHPETRSGAGHF